MTFTTNTETLQSGTMAIQFYLPDTATITSTVYIESVSNLKYEFEVPSSTESPNAIGTKPGTIKVTLMQRFRGTELVDAFEKLSGTDKYLAKMTFTEVGTGISGNKFFYIDRSALEYDEIDQLLEIELTPVPLIYVASANNGTIVEGTVNGYLNGDYNADLTNLPNLYTDSVTSETAVVVGEFIENVLELITKSTNLVFLSPNFNLTPPSTGVHWLVESSTPASYTLTDMFGVIASVEGSIYGSFFDETFYVSRASTDVSITETLSYSVVKNITRERFNLAEYREIVVTLGADGVSSVFNDFAEKTLNVSFQLGNLTSANIASLSSYTVNSPPPTDIQVSGINNYSKALGLTNRITGEIEVLGFNLKPYSRITFHADAPSVFQGKTFAISTIEYDFVNYNIKANIYEIAIT